MSNVWWVAGLVYQGAIWSYLTDQAQNVADKASKTKNQMKDRMMEFQKGLDRDREPSNSSWWSDVTAE